ncbi:ABC transporter substrate-binding protein [Paenibacillus cremeus]|uniref:Sugar ABC transporter substrate-binding protein n=1 Tax=Paenibacillus cremeus TaxID=2163881 RepID=A0A559JVU9_9BACL|nr:sugar ABC transporter substrate-binding protein [Paenibacillus cremeus]TVY04021.1 sugar ABC transporter substrate-binding protein [Paenibacillus cremeus]
MKTKSVSMLLLTLCTTAAIVGCSSGGSNSGGGAAAPKPTGNAPSAAAPSAPASAPAGGGAQKEVRVSWYGDAQRNKIYDKTYDEIQKKLPELKITREFAASNDYYTKLNTQTAGGNAPDLMIFTLYTLYDYAKRGQLLDLQPYVDKGIIDLKNFDKSIIDSGRVDGKLLTVSQGNSILASFYNKDLFSKAGVAEPTFDWTWDEFSEKMIALTAKLGKGTWGSVDLGGSINQLQAFLKQRGKDLYSADGGLGFEKKDMIDWYTMWDNLRQKGGIPPADVTAEYDGKPEAEGLFGLGKVAVRMGASNQLALAQDIMKNTKLGIARMPQTKGGTSYDQIAGVYMGIYTKSKVPEETAKIINLFANDLNAAKEFGLLYGPVGQTNIMKELEPTLSPAMKAVNDYQKAVSKNTGPTNPYPVASNAVNKLIADNNQQIAYKQKTIAQAVDAFFAESEKLLKR